MEDINSVVQSPSAIEQIARENSQSQRADARAQEEEQLQSVVVDQITLSSEGVQLSQAVDISEETQEEPTSLQQMQQADRESAEVPRFLDIKV